MFRCLLIVAMTVSVVTVAVAQDRPPLPRGPAPQYQLASAAEDGGAVVVRFTRVVHQTKQVQVEEDGKKLLRNVVESGWSDIDVPVDGKEVRALGADGKAIHPKDL